MIIKIQSISDIITNSSSEVFVIYDDNSVKTLKEVVSRLIGDDFDNRFKVEYELSDWAVDEYMADKNKGDISLEEWCIAYEETNQYSPAIIGLNISAKDPKDNELAAAISKLPYLFDYEERCC